MKFLKSLLIITGIFSLSSCIKDEAKNPEADIEKVYFAPEDNIQLVFQPVIRNSNVTIMLPPQVDRTTLKPRFTLSKGATISPASGTERDFTQQQIYTVTSEDGKWSKKYTIRVMGDNMVSKYDFENYDREDYDVFYENIIDGSGNVERQDIWASGNPAASIVLDSEIGPEGYPTSAAPGLGRSGTNMTAAKLQTIKTGPLGVTFGKPIAAGNLFIGVFDGSNLWGEARLMTEFGFPINKKPMAFKGWYKYTPGERDINGLPFNDECRIYAIFYKSEDGTRLNGTNIMTSPNIVAKAIFDNPVPTTQWKPYENRVGDGEILFDYGSNVVDEEDLANYKYYLAIVFSSSRYGDDFRGAIGSTLLIDEVEILYEE